MQLVVLADEIQKSELAASLPPESRMIWIRDEREFLAHKEADAFLDLKFVNEESRKALLAQLLPKPVVVNSVIDTLPETHPAFVRINGWPSFLSSPLVEAACNGEAAKQGAENAFAGLGKTLEWLPDRPGFVTARVVSTIVNEAFLALGEGVSTKEEINTAMKLGTAYPYGPFEWAEKIGLQNIAALLQKLRKAEPRYRPSEGLVREAL